MKRSFNVIVVIIYIVISELSTIAAEDNFYINESVEIFAAVLEELEKNYLGEIDKSMICTTSLNSLTANLDPYTAYFPSRTEDYYDEEGKISIGGIGVEILEEGGKKYLSRIYKNSTAHRSGLRVGDEIVSINKISVGSKSIDQVINLLKGAPGTLIIVQVARFSFSSPIIATMRIERLEPYNMVLSKILSNDIGYIRLQQFGKNSANEMKEVIAYFKTLGVTKLVLDLRDNEGGVIEEVVQILEQFLEPESLIMRTTGKSVEFDKEYRTSNESPDTTMPIVVLVNGKSASAAEIVAGVMQEYDRAIIMGHQTFGKGTIQTIVSMPYGAHLKLTTARYILPSGRHILAFDKVPSPDSEANFKTASGRTISEQRGIVPDILLPQKGLSNISSYLLDFGVIRDYATYFSSKHGELVKLSDFKLSDKQYQDFIDWFSTRKVKFESEISLEKIILDPRSNLSENLKKQMHQLLFHMADANRQRLRHLKSEIKPLLEYSIVEYCHMYEDALEFYLERDPCLKQAMKVLIDKSAYKKMLKLV